MNKKAKDDGLKFMNRDSSSLPDAAPSNLNGPGESTSPSNNVFSTSILINDDKTIR